MFGGSHSAKLHGFLPNQYCWALDVLPVSLSRVFIWVLTTGTILGGMEIIKLASSMQHLYHFEQEKQNVDLALHAVFSPVNKHEGPCLGTCRHKQAEGV